MDLHLIYGRQTTASGNFSSVVNRRHPKPMKRTITAVTLATATIGPQIGASVGAGYDIGYGVAGAEPINFFNVKAGVYRTGS